MRLRVLYFAVLRERRGASTDEIQLKDDATVADALSHLAALQPQIAALLPRVQVAVNQMVVPSSTQLGDGDELALLPPVSGGSGPRRIAIEESPLRLDEVAEAATERCPSPPGAVVTFTGLVRRHGHVPDVVRLEYEAYREMALQVLEEIADEIEREIGGSHIAIHHRTGHLVVGEIAVVVAAATAHRAEAFDACREAIERLKQRAPIWKKEIGENGAEWVGLGP